MTTRHTLTLLAAAPLALALASCGSSDTATGSATSSGGSGATSASTSASAGSTAGSIYALCDKAGQLKTDDFLAASKATQGATKTAHLDGTMTGPTAGTISADSDSTDPANPKVNMTMTVKDQAMKMVMLDKTAYVQIPGRAKWLKLTPEQLAKTSGMDPTTMFDPAAQLQKQKDMITSVTCVGREDVGGKQAAHVKVTMDATKALGTNSASLPPSASAQLSNTTAETWYDEQSRPLKSHSAASGVTADMTFSKFNEPVTVTAPPADQVEDAGAAVGGGAAGGAPATGPTPGANTLPETFTSK